jgi:hypothetical protein
MRGWSVCRRGTVTFLFTDVGGSTRLLHELGSVRYACGLAEHRRAPLDVLDVFGSIALA